MVNNDKHYIKMTQSPVEPLIMRLAVPTVISMLVSSIYNMADTFFVYLTIILFVSIIYKTIIQIQV